MTWTHQLLFPSDRWMETMNTEFDCCHFLVHPLSLSLAFTFTSKTIHFLLLSPVCDNEHWVLILSVSFTHAFTFYCIQLHFLPNSLSLSITFTCMWPGHHQVLLLLSDESNNCCSVVTCIFFYTYFLLHYCLLPLSICSVFPHTMLNAGLCDLATKCCFCQTREKTSHWVVLLSLSLFKFFLSPFPFHFHVFYLSHT